jgi:AcrR family transcriptional regulator
MPQRVASSKKLANVSVGSLYQYFSSKEALIEALMNNMASDIGKGLQRLPISETSTLRDLVTGAIHYGFTMLNSRNGLYLELARNWHRLPTDKVANALQQHFLELSRIYFLKYYREYPIENLEVRIFIIVNSTIFTMVRLISQENSMWREEDVENGLIEMILAYLQTKTTAA